jgi:hypothetical protein
MKPNTSITSNSELQADRLSEAGFILQFDFRRALTYGTFKTYTCRRGGADRVYYRFPLLHAIPFSAPMLDGETIGLVDLPSRQTLCPHPLEGERFPRLLFNREVPGSVAEDGIEPLN